MQYTFVNGRFVRDKLLRHAARLGYQDVLYQARQPAFVIVSDARSAPRRRQRAPGQARDPLPRLAARARLRVSNHRVGAGKHLGVDRRHAAAAAGRFCRGTLQPPPAGFAAGTLQPSPAGFAAVRDARAGSQGGFSFPGRVSEQAPLYHRLHSAAPPPVAPRGESGPAIPPLGYALAQLSGIYVLAENSDGLIIVDMHAAHERITYEQMKRSFGENKLAPQYLLVPIDVVLSCTEADLVDEYREDLERLGFQIVRRGDSEVQVQAVHGCSTAAISQPCSATCSAILQRARGQVASSPLPMSCSARWPVTPRSKRTANWTLPK
jgi:DNA mismatch repair protein MutL